MTYSGLVMTPTGRELDLVECCGPGRRTRLNSELSDPDAAEIAAACQALASPVRLRLLAVMQAAPAGEACVCDLVDEVELSQSTVSHHLAVLVDSGLVRQERRGTWAWYALVPGRLDALRVLLARPGVAVG